MGTSKGIKSLRDSGVTHTQKGKVDENEKVLQQKHFLERKREGLDINFIPEINIPKKIHEGRPSSQHINQLTKWYL